MQSDLAVDVGACRPAERAKLAYDELQKQRRHGRTFRVMHPVTATPVRVAALGRGQALAVSTDKIVDDCARFREAQSVVLYNWRLSQRMDAPQARRGALGLRVPLVGDDFVVEPDLFEEPQDALRARVVEMMNLDHGKNSRPPSRRPLGHTTPAGPLREIFTPSAARITQPNATLRPMRSGRCRMPSAAPSPLIATAAPMTIPTYDTARGSSGSL